MQSNLLQQLRFRIVTPAKNSVSRLEIIKKVRKEYIYMYAW